MWICVLKKLLYFKSPAPEAVVKELTEGNVYQFRVRAVNKAGASEPSDATGHHLSKPKNRKTIFFLYLKKNEYV